MDTYTTHREMVQIHSIYAVGCADTGLVDSALFRQVLANQIERLAYNLYAEAATTPQLEDTVLTRQYLFVHHQSWAVASVKIQCGIAYAHDELERYIARFERSLIYEFKKILGYWDDWSQLLDELFEHRLELGDLKRRMHGINCAYYGPLEQQGYDVSQAADTINRRRGKPIYRVFAR